MDDESNEHLIELMSLHAEITRDSRSTIKTRLVQDSAFADAMIDEFEALARSNVELLKALEAVDGEILLTGQLQEIVSIAISNAKRDIPANWRDDPLEDTPPVRGAFRSRTLDEVLASLPAEEQKAIHARFEEIMRELDSGATKI